MEIKDYTEIEKNMTLEQKKASKYMYDRFYGNEFGNSEEVMCSTSDEDNEPTWLDKVDLDLFT